MSNMNLKHLPDAITSLTGTPTIQAGSSAPGGLFSTPGLQTAMLSTIPVAKPGFAELLPAYPSDQLYEEFPFLTAFDDADPNQDLPNTVCEPAPMPGLVRGATMKGPAWGQITMDTNEINVTKLGMKAPATSGPFELMGYNTGLPGANLLYPGSVANPGDIINNLASMEMHKVGLAAWRKTSKWVWSGVNGSTGAAAYNPFNGLDTMLVTGQKDAQTNTAVPEFDPTIINWQNKVLTDPSQDIVGQLQELEQYLVNRADSELMGAQFVLVMRSEMWQELTTVWPLLYGTQDIDSLLANGTAISVNVNADTMLALRYSMRNSQVIDINGRAYPVILDDTIPYQDSTTAALPKSYYASTIYFLPLSVANGFPAFYWQYYDFQESLNLANQIMAGHGDFFWTDAGRFAWAINQEQFCLKMKFTGQMRLVSRVPQLCARITHVAYQRGRKDRDVYPDWPYGAQSGVSLRNTPPVRYSVY